MTAASEQRRDAIVSVRDLQVRFQTSDRRATVKAVDGVNFDVRRGETFGIIGESGSGKTTIGRALVFLLKPSAGSILHDGIDPLALSRAGFQLLTSGHIVSGGSTITMQLARLTKRFAWIGAKFDVEIAGFPDVEINGQVFQLNYTLTSQGREIARVDAEYSGMGRAMMGKTSYRVRIQPGLDERQHAAIIGIALAIDMRRAKMRRRSG